MYISTIVRKEKKQPSQPKSNKICSLVLDPSTEDLEEALQRPQRLLLSTIYQPGLHLPSARGLHWVGVCFCSPFCAEGSPAALTPGVAAVLSPRCPCPAPCHSCVTQCVPRAHTDTWSHCPLLPAGCCFSQGVPVPSSLPTG